ncbi:leiomodin-2-like [Rhopalosiphum padi]|uniref:leiomodin-2-like n=1 Tax=Rhopalosiphum padi TaxID=40932 RepID=UPI00298DE303|nr:leiomodin-2-like [Rhopalosiphum padi]
MGKGKKISNVKRNKEGPRRPSGPGPMGSVGTFHTCGGGGGGGGDDDDDGAAQLIPPPPPPPPPSSSSPLPPPMLRSLATILYKTPRLQKNAVPSIFPKCEHLPHAVQISNKKPRTKQQNELPNKKKK